MKSIITLTGMAESDILDIHSYVELFDSPESADYLVDGITKAISSLEHMPDRGHYPPELAKIGIHEFQEIHFKPYRIVYSINGKEVIIHCVLDGRRDMQTLLQQRLLH